MQKLFLFASVILLFMAGCSSSDKKTLDNDVHFQVVSALGDTLGQAPHKGYKDSLKSWKQHYQHQSENTRDDLSYSQKLSQAGQHRQAVDVLSQALKNKRSSAHLHYRRGIEHIALRSFSAAINDFETALNDSLSTKTTSNLWREIGISYYLKGNFDKAAKAQRKSLKNSSHPSENISSIYWLYSSLRRDGKDGEAGNVLEKVSKDLSISRGKDYYQLLLVYKGVFKPDMLLHELKDSNALDNATIGYGIGNWHYINGRKKRARKLFKKVYQSSEWDSPGYIAAEQDLAHWK